MSDKQQHDEQQPPKQAPFTAKRAATIAEQRILEAMERGDFDNLRGAGKPLNLDDDAHVPEELRMAHRMLKNQGYAPPWIEAHKDLRNQLERLRRYQEQTRARWQTLSEDQRDKARTHVREQVRDLNRQALSFNLTAPLAVKHLEMLLLDQELLLLEP